MTISRRKRRVGIGLAASLVLTAFLTVSCEGRAVEEPELPALSGSKIDGARLWERITNESDYGSYAEWPGHEGLRPGQSPHGAWHVVRVNRTLREALPSSDAMAPAGSIIVKENYSADKTLAKITVMAKAPGFNTDNGDWFWASYDPDGTVSAEGSLNGCITCHEGMKGNDYVIIRPLDEPF